MASYGQTCTICYLAFDQSAHAGKTGDVANHTLRLVKDGSSAAPTNLPAEVDSTNAPGIYKLVLTTAESQHNVVILCGKSSTANVTIEPVQITFEMLPTPAPGAQSGLMINGANSGAVSFDQGIAISNSVGDGLSISGTGNGISINPGSTGAGLRIQGGASSGNAILATALGSDVIRIQGFGGHGINASGSGANHGIRAVGGSTGNGLFVQGGGTSGAGLHGEAQGGNSNGIEGVANGAGSGIYPPTSTTRNVTINNRNIQVTD